MSTKEGTIIEKATGQECWSVLLLSQKKRSILFDATFSKEKPNLTKSFEPSQRAQRKKCHCEVKSGR